MRWLGITHEGYPFDAEIDRLSSQFLIEYTQAIEQGYLKIACFSTT